MVVREVSPTARVRDGAGREPAARGPEPDRGGRGLPAPDRRVRLHAGVAGRAGRQGPQHRRQRAAPAEAARRACASLVAEDGCRWATPAPCSGLDTADAMEKLARRVVAQDLSVRQVEELVKRERAGGAVRAAPAAHAALGQRARPGAAADPRARHPRRRRRVDPGQGGDRDSLSFARPAGRPPRSPAADTEADEPGAAVPARLPIGRGAAGRLRDPAGKGQLLLDSA